MTILKTKNNNIDEYSIIDNQGEYFLKEKYPKPSVQKFCGDLKIIKSPLNGL